MDKWGGQGIDALSFLLFHYCALTTQNEKLGSEEI